MFSFSHLNLDADVRLARRIRRDTVERGRDVNSVLEQVRNRGGRMLIVLFLNVVQHFILSNVQFFLR